MRPTPDTIITGGVVVDGDFSHFYPLPNQGQRPIIKVTLSPTESLEEILKEQPNISSLGALAFDALSRKAGNSEEVPMISGGSHEDITVINNPDVHCTPHAIDIPMQRNQAYGSLDIPPQASRVMIVQRICQLGNRTVSSVFGAPDFSLDGGDVSFKEADLKRIRDFGAGIELGTTAKEQNTSRNSEKSRRKEILRRSYSRTMNEVLTKAIVTNSLPLEQQELRDTLTERYREILIGLAIGRTLRETAACMGIAWNTARDYLKKNVFPTLGARTQGQAIYRAFETGIFTRALNKHREA